MWTWSERRGQLVGWQSSEVSGGDGWHRPPAGIERQSAIGRLGLLGVRGSAPRRNGQDPEARSWAQATCRPGELNHELDHATTKAHREHGKTAGHRPGQAARSGVQRDLPKAPHPYRIGGFFLASADAASCQGRVCCRRVRPLLNKNCLLSSARTRANSQPVKPYEKDRRS
jgi:hypothetical protein